MCPWIGTISLAFVGPPAVKVQLSPYNRVRLMRIPVLQVGALAEHNPWAWRALPALQFGLEQRPRGALSLRLPHHTVRAGIRNGEAAAAPSLKQLHTCGRALTHPNPTQTRANNAPRSRS